MSEEKTRPLPDGEIAALRKKTHAGFMVRTTRKHLEYIDLRGTTQNVTIAEVFTPEAYSHEEKKKIPTMALKFKGKDKYLIVRPVHQRQLAEILGSQDVDLWINKRIALTACEIKVSGTWTPVIRISKPVRKSRKDKK